MRTNVSKEQIKHLISMCVDIEVTRHLEEEENYNDFHRSILHCWVTHKINEAYRNLEARHAEHELTITRIIELIRIYIMLFELNK